MSEKTTFKTLSRNEKLSYLLETKSINQLANDYLDLYEKYNRVLDKVKPIKITEAQFKTFFTLSSSVPSKRGRKPKAIKDTTE